MKQVEEYLDRASDLLVEMRENAEIGDMWKNIPLAKDYLKLLQDAALAGAGAVEIAICCDAIFNENLLEVRDVPRLCLQFLKLRPDTDDTGSFDESFFLDEDTRRVERDNLEAYIDLSYPMEEWVAKTGRTLLFDSVERTKQWEDNIYEVESECDELLQEQPRGMGFCFHYWSVKAAVLAKHGIQWNSPAVMNPRVMFD